jgi:hypothetical protein
VAGVTIYQESDAFVFVLLQKRNIDTDVWEPEDDADSVVIEVFDPNGDSIGSKDLTSGVTYVGDVEAEGYTWGKYRASFHFEEPGVYESQARCVGQGGGQVASRDDIPVENL